MEVMHKTVEYTKGQPGKSVNIKKKNDLIGKMKAKNLKHSLNGIK